MIPSPSAPSAIFQFLIESLATLIFLLHLISLPRDNPPQSSIPKSSHELSFRSQTSPTQGDHRRREICSLLIRRRRKREGQGTNPYSENSDRDYSFEHVNLVPRDEAETSIVSLPNASNQGFDDNPNIKCIDSSVRGIKPPQHPSCAAPRLTIIRIPCRGKQQLAQVQRRQTRGKQP